MNPIDIERLLRELSLEAPCGEDLEYDPAFVKMEQAAQGKPEQQFGETIIPAQEPNWREVHNKALTLLSRSKDLRVATYLVRSLVHTDGLVGLNNGLSLLRGLLERYWDTVHPQLDPEDDNDPTMRLNALISLRDPETMLRSVREAPLASSRTLGQVSLRDIDIAMGRLPVVGSDKPPLEMPAIDAVFMDCALDELQATAAAVEQAIEHAEAIETLLMNKLGSAHALDLSALIKLLKHAHHVLSQQLASRGMEIAVADTGEVINPSLKIAVANSNRQGTGRPVLQPVAGEINSREDVIRMLDKLCEYFVRHEPSSPVPLLLNRAKRLVSKDFIEIIRDLAPDGLSQIEMIRGPDSEEISE